MEVKQIKRRKKWWIVLIAIWIVFFVYNNINLTPKREMVHFNSINVSGTEVVYNITIQKIASPLFYQGTNGRAVLLLHGFGGTPYEMHELGEYLWRNNFSVYIPLLPEHGDTVNKLSKLKWQEAYSFVNDSYFLLNKKYDKVYVGGLSNGGLLSLKLGIENNISGIIPLGTPIILSNKYLDKLPLRYILIFTRVLTPYLRRMSYGVSRDPEVEKNLPSFDRFPVNSLITLEDLKQNLKKNMISITSPILILQSTWDNRASPESADFIYSHVSSKIKKLIWLNNSGHVITLDYDKQQVFEEILKFINEN